MHPHVKSELLADNIPYRILKHSDFGSVKTVEDFARLSGIPTSKIAKTLFVADKKAKRFGMAILGATNRANLQEIQKLLQFSELCFGSLEELKNITGYEKFGTIAIATNLQTVMDESLLHEDKVYVATGTVGEELEIDPHDLQKITGALVGQITEK